MEGLRTPEDPNVGHCIGPYFLKSERVKEKLPLAAKVLPTASALKRCEIYERQGVILGFLKKA